MIITLYVAHPTTNEYGNLDSPIGFFYSKLDAKEAVKGQGWYGGNGSVVERKAIIHEGQVYLLDEEITYPIVTDVNLIEREKQVVENALGKLTDEEKKALNLRR